MTKLFFTADWHLAEGAWKSRPEIYGDAFESLYRLCEMCTTDDYIFAAGDLFDTKHPSAKTIVTAQQVLTRTYVNSVYFIQGQHEMSEVPWFFALSGHHLNLVNQRIGGVISGSTQINIYGLDWSLGLHLQERLDHIGEQLKQNYNKNDFNILMLHQTCNAVVAGTGPDREQRIASLDYRASELKDNMIPDGFDLCVVGDTHYHTEFQLIDKVGKAIRCLSPGSFAMQSLSETNTGQCFVMDADTCEITSQALYRRPYQEISIETPVAFDQEIRDRIKAKALVDQFNIPIIKYTIYENDADRISALKQACKNKVFPFFYILASETAEVTTDISTNAKDTTELVNIAINEAVASDASKQLLTELVNADSADDILASYYKTIVLKA
jgi:DNA repair exonuclease SbcCD nuclease subunit